MTSPLSIAVAKALLVLHEGGRMHDADAGRIRAALDAEDQAAAALIAGRLRPAPCVPAELLARLPSAQWLDDLAAGRVGAMSQHARETYKLACEWLRGRPPAAPEAPRVLAEAPKAAAMADPAPASPTTRAAIPES